MDLGCTFGGAGETPVAIQSVILPRMLMVIFGAGASYDSAQAYPLIYPGGGAYPSALKPTREPWRPPLAKELFLDHDHYFGHIVENYGKLTHILPYLRQPTGGKTVEEVLETLLAESKGNPETKKELASVRFYLCQLRHQITEKWHSQTNGATNYAPLIREILLSNKSNEPVCLVTFNYDLLLEHALYTFGFKVSQPNVQYDSHSILKLFKLHGSVGWARIVDAPSGTRMEPQALIETADTLKLTDDFVLANPTDFMQFHQHGRPIFPAIAMPVQTKTEEFFECPSSHRKKLCELLKLVNKVLIIGWQAKEAHFTQIPRSNLPPLQHICVVGSDGPDANKTLIHFMREIGQSTYSTAKSYPSPGRFTDFIVNAHGKDFLEAR